MAHASDIRTSGPSILDRASDRAGGLFSRFMQYRAYRKTVAELSNLSDHELNDLGFGRSSIKRVAFEATYN
ncbi:DUF1127 domain-containing protein [Thalassorhabdomicrobium marinisediminis]|uniref:YjiS-like domain-containing protein n=1 Tax=Thalassorhabdomicrobium marinisediminis TaxID=2170577 RepID=A0A2T7FXV6_9RHOB|nr:DUF1127 domain-containing protein [Thalassorhabdomicrobium marinisediminis]PVA07000.1 hypothetical protein DC363_07620 [Thalassorhabdomicrobium marinisediminis]